MQGSGHDFVGRHVELTHLANALAAAQQGKGRVVLLSGEPGIGKTQTVIELTGRAEAAAVRVLWGRCQQEPGAPPYWPWTQVLRALAEQLDDAELAAALGDGAADILDILPELAPRLGDPARPSLPSDPAGARFRLFDSLSRFLLAAARHRPLLVVLDDAHWSDAPSLRLLRFLAPNVGGGRLLLIMTYRENELSRQHPLSDALGDLARSPATSRLRLQGLAADEVSDLMARTAGPIASPGLVRALHAQTEGNPLFLREIMRFLDQRGLLNGAGPRASVPASIRVPEGIREVIGQRLNLLPQGCSQVLRIASVIGRDFGLDVLRRAAGGEAEAIAAALDDALDARLVEEVRPDHYQFTHAMVQMTLYDELRLGERRLHRAVGLAIETARRGDIDSVLSELARHFQQAGGGDARAIDYAMRAGRRADAALAYEDAVSFFQAALDHLQQQDKTDPRAHCEALIRLGDAQYKIRNFGPAKETLQTALGMARRHQLHDLFADAAVAFELAAWLEGYVGHRSSDVLEEALTLLPAEEEARRIQVTAQLARSQLYSGAVDAARATALGAAARARALGDASTAARSLIVLLEIPDEPEDTERNLATILEIVDVAERARDTDLVVRATFRAACQQLELSRMEACRNSLARCDELLGSSRHVANFFFALGARSTLALMRGDLDEAERHIMAALRFGRPGVFDSADGLAVGIFALRREQDRLRELAPVLQAVMGQGSAAIWQPGLALLRLELGQPEEARRLLDSMAADGFAALPRDGRWTAALAYMAETCATLRDPAHATELYRMLLPYAGRNLVLGNASGCVGAADRLLGSLAATIGHTHEAERHFSDAEALNERTGAVVPLGYTRCDHAAMLLERNLTGDSEKARGLVAAARDSAATLGLPALARRATALAARLVPTVAPDELTGRETEVLRLLAIGRTNADIALVLSISVATVATHVRSILAKTGCANRTEAAAYAMSRGLGGGLAAAPP